MLLLSYNCCMQLLQRISGIKTLACLTPRSPESRYTAARLDPVHMPQVSLPQTPETRATSQVCPKLRKLYCTEVPVVLL